MTQKITIQQGTTFLYNGTLSDSTNTPVNLTGYSFSGSIRKTPQDTPIMFSFALLDQTSFPGQFTASMAASVTEKIPTVPFDAPTKGCNEYLGDMNIIFPNGNIYRFFEFIASIDSMVTPINV